MIKAVLKHLKRSYIQARARREYKKAMSPCTKVDSIDTYDFAYSLRDPNTYYRKTLKEYNTIVPHEIRTHRQYFSIESRGFGEDALHAMWWHLVTKFKPESFLEIGVYRGQVISLVSLISKLNGNDCKITGISPFSSAGDSVSKYLHGLDYYEDVIINFKYFHLPMPTLVRAYSTDRIAIDTILSRRWDMIYIDGNHDYDVVKMDWEICSNAANIAGLIVIDDSGLTTRYKPPIFATGGHAGPSRLASEIDPERFREILQVGHNRVFQKIA